MLYFASYPGLLYRLLNYRASLGTRLMLYYNLTQYKRMAVMLHDVATITQLYSYSLISLSVETQTIVIVFTVDS